MKTNENIFFSIVAFIGVSSFFLPWFGTQFGSFSGYDIQSLSCQFNLKYAWTLYLFPISFLIIGITLFEIGKKIPDTVTKCIKLIPISLLIFLFIHLLIKSEDGAPPIFLFEDFFFSIRIGLYLKLLASMIIIFMPNRRSMSV